MPTNNEITSKAAHIEAQKVQVGDYIRAYDFAGNPDCYQHGVVTEVKGTNECVILKFRVIGAWAEGKSYNDMKGEMVETIREDSPMLPQPGLIIL